MTIDFSLVVKYAKVCDKLKDDSQPIYDSGLLDFEHQTMTFGSQKGFGCIPMKVEGWDGKRAPFFVKLNSLLNIAREFPVLERVQVAQARHGRSSGASIGRLYIQAWGGRHIRDCAHRG